MQPCVCPPHVTRLAVDVGIDGAVGPEKEAPVPEGLQRNAGRKDRRHVPAPDDDDHHESDLDHSFGPVVREDAHIKQQNRDARQEEADAVKQDVVPCCLGCGIEGQY